MDAPDGTWLSGSNVSWARKRTLHCLGDLWLVESIIPKDLKYEL